MANKESDTTLLSFIQKHEIDAARTLEADVDYAYYLQLQEAITASVGNQSSSSTSSSYKNVVIPVSPETECFDYTGLLIEDLAKLEQEREDREASERLSKSFRQDFDRYIHDRNFASEIINIPDDEWQSTGDYVHKPYQCVGSSSNTELFYVDKEHFKVYCKGIKSEEIVKGIKVIVAGIGVAVCDKKDDLIFEVSKGLDDVIYVDDDGDDMEIVLKAIIEGLNAAMDLGLRNILFYVDDLMVYEYVTGKNAQARSDLATLLGKLNSLRKSCVYCEPIYVTSDELKFAYKFARIAIVSQIKWDSGGDRGKKILETCPICYEDTCVDQIFSVDSCLHRYCFSCMKRHAEAKLLEGREVKCPHEKCTSELCLEACGQFLDQKLVNILIERKNESSIPVMDKVYCPYKTCSTLMSKNEILSRASASTSNVQMSGFVRCIKCQKFFCMNCKVPWHNNMTCAVYKASNAHRQAEDGLLDWLAQRKLWRQCMKCKNMVELAFGCYHITCRCGYEFCYTCGAEWKNKKATCRCPIWDERNIIRDR